MPLDPRRQSMDITRLIQSLTWALEQLEQPAPPPDREKLPLAEWPEYKQAREALRLAIEDENYPYILKADRRLKIAAREYTKLTAPQDVRPDQKALDAAQVELTKAWDSYLTQLSRLVLWPS